MLTLVQVCRVVRDAPFSAKRRPKFISVTISGARFWERSTLSNWFNLYENRYNPLYRMSRRAEALGYARRSPPARAVADYLLKDHKPSAMRGEARLRGLERIISSKTIKNDQNNPPLNADRGKIARQDGRRTSSKCRTSGGRSTHSRDHPAIPSFGAVATRQSALLYS